MIIDSWKRKTYLLSARRGQCGVVNDDVVELLS
jgi:hypothetical protein